MSITYDAKGRVASVVQGVRHLDMVYDATTGFRSEIHDAQGHILKTLRDTAGRVTSVVRPDLTALGVGYDPGDNVTSVTPPGKTAHAFELQRGRPGDEVHAAE